MLSDPRARNTLDLPHQIAHLHDVTTDIMNRHWPSVRQWSHFVFDEIEKGTFLWSDYQSIQNARCAMSFMGPSGAHDGPDARSASREVICMEYNSKSCSNGGKFRHHTENGVRFIHACMYCFASTGARRDHPMSDPCNQKQRDKSASHGANHFFGGNYQGHQNQHVYQHPNAGVGGAPRYKQHTFGYGMQQQGSNPQQLSTQIQSVPKNQ